MPPPIFSSGSIKGHDWATLRSLYLNRVLRSHLDRVALTCTKITRLRVDVIVNPARTDLLGNDEGTDYDIHRAAGSKLIEECKKLGGCTVGEAKVTDSYKLPSKYIIHTVGPVYDACHADEREELLESCYTSVLSKAVSIKARTIALPLVSVDKRSGFPEEKVIRVALNAVRNFLSTAEGDEIGLVVFVTRSDNEKNIFKRVIPEFFPSGI